MFKLLQHGSRPEIYYLFLFNTLFVFLVLELIIELTREITIETYLYTIDVKIEILYHLEEARPYSRKYNLCFIRLAVNLLKIELIQTSVPNSTLDSFLSFNANSYY